MFEWIAESCPNWLKPLPGLILLGISVFIMFTTDRIWIGGFAIGAAMLVIGIAFMRFGKSSGYNF